MYTNKSILHTKITSKDYQTLSKKDIVWKIDVNSLDVPSLQGLLLLFLDKRNGFANKNEEFYNPSIKKILMAINGDPHQLFKGGLGARDIYPELKKYFYKEHSNVTWEEFLTAKFGLWIDTRTSIDNTLHGGSRRVEKGMLLQIQKAPETSGGNLTCYLFTFEDEVAHLSVIENPGAEGILIIKK